MAFKKKSHEEEFELFLQSVELFTKESVGLFLSRRPRGSRMPSRSSRLVMPHEDLVALALAIRRNGALMRTAEQVVADETPA